MDHFDFIDGVLHAEQVPLPVIAAAVDICTKSGERITGDPVPAQGAGGLQGFDYAYDDYTPRPAETPVYYWLEELHGDEAYRHGPLRVGGGKGSGRLPSRMRAKSADLSTSSSSTCGKAVLPGSNCTKSRASPHVQSAPITWPLKPNTLRSPARATSSTVRVWPGSKRTAVPAAMLRRWKRARSKP